MTLSKPRFLASSIVMFGMLYLFAAAILSWRIGSEPSNPVNWENYSLRGLIDFLHDPTWDVVRLNGGLMTDSGQSAVVVGPGWIGFNLFGMTLLGLRLPIALIAAISVPLTWLLGRALHSPFVGLVGSILVATSQVFLIYGRTGTNVGMSITPALIGCLLLWRCVKPDEERWWRWLIGLQIALIVNSYFYSPIRFLWPIVLVLLALEFAIRRGERKRFLLSLIATAVWLPIAVSLLRPGPLENPISAVRDYYYGRGEQVFDIDRFPDGFKSFLRADSVEEQERIATESDEDLALRLIRQNAVDLFKLLSNRDTLPPNENYWNPQGRLYPLGLVPLFLIGTVILLVRIVSDPRARLLLALFWGFSLPLLLTSRVHIGRLVFIVPILAIVCAIPLGELLRWIGRKDRQAWRPIAGRWFGLAGGTALVAISVVPSLNYWNEPFPYDRTVLVEQRIDLLVRTAAGDRFVYVFGDLGGYEVEELRVANFEIAFRDQMQFVDMTNGNVRGSGPITFVYGGIVPLLVEPNWLPGYCTNLYLIEPDQLERFREATDRLAPTECDGPLRTEVLDV